MRDSSCPSNRVAPASPPAPAPPPRERYQDQLAASKAEFEAWRLKGGFSGAAAAHRPTTRRVRRQG